MEETGEDFIITWHGGPVVSGCEFFFRTISSTSMLCINLQKITFPCDTEATLTIINQDHDNGPYTVILYKHTSSLLTLNVVSHYHILLQACMICSK